MFELLDLLDLNFTECCLCLCPEVELKTGNVSQKQNYELKDSESAAEVKEMLEMF